MKRKALLFISLVLALLMLSSSLSFAASGVSGKNATSSKTSSSNFTFPLAKQIKIKVLTGDFGRGRDTRVDKELEKLTNIKINYELVSLADIAEKVNVYLASGVLPDVMVTTPDPVKLFQNYGVFVDFSKWVDKLPNYKKYAEKYADILNYYKTKSGGVYALNNFTRQGQLPYGYLYRDDIYAKNNIKIPATFNELYDSLKKLKKIYPNSYPMTGSPTFLGMMYDAYHTNKGIYFDMDSMQFKYGPDSQRFIDALNFVKKLYSEKLLNPEFSIFTHEQTTQNMVSGKSFVNLYYIGMITEYTTKGKQVDPGFSMTAALPPVTDTGLQAKVGVQYPVSNWWMTVVSAKSKYVNEIMHLLDFEMTDKIIDLVNWGFEGETYKVVNGIKKWMPNVKTSLNPAGKIDLKALGIDGRSGIWPPYDIEAGQWSVASDKEYNNTKLYIDNADKIAKWSEPAIQMSTQMTQQKSKDMATLDTAIDEAANNYIIGKIGLDQLKKTVQNIKNKNVYQKYLDYMNKEFKKMKSTFKFNKGI